MKIHIITISETVDGNELLHEPVPFLSAREARKELKRIARLAEKAYNKKFNRSSKGADFFSIWLDDDYLRYHYTVKLTETVVAPKFGLNAVFGETAAREAGEAGFKSCCKSIEKGEIDGSWDSVRFDTEEDRNKAAALLDMADGWLGTYWEKTK